MSSAIPAVRGSSSRRSRHFTAGMDMSVFGGDHLRTVRWSQPTSTDVLHLQSFTASNARVPVIAAVQALFGGGSTWCAETCATPLPRRSSHPEIHRIPRRRTLQPSQAIPRQLCGDTRQRKSHCRAQRNRSAATVCMTERPMIKGVMGRAREIAGVHLGVGGRRDDQPRDITPRPRAHTRKGQTACSSRDCPSLLSAGKNVIATTTARGATRLE